VHGLYTEGFKFDMQSNIIIMDDNINEDIFVIAPWILFQPSNLSGSVSNCIQVPMYKIVSRKG
jgi:hypothetical protein